MPAAAVDRLAGEVMRLPVNDERDAFHQSLALANAGGWLNKIATAEFVERKQAALGGGDAELLALTAEYQRLLGCSGIRRGPLTVHLG